VPVQSSPMSAEILLVDPVHPQRDRIARAAAVLRGGGLVAFPTETVYGLGADALSDAAVRKIFAAKGRPPNNPVIVHVADVEAARQLATSWPTTAQRAAARWWPGPLTIVLPKAALVPDVVSAGGPTVALRCPAHPVTRALIAATGRPLAAPSANPSTRVSSTRAEHVARGLGDKIDLILDGGPAVAGLESTVVDLSGPIPRLLRPGPIAWAELVEVFGPALQTVNLHAGEQDAALPSPGLLRKHYSPTVPLMLVDDDGRERVAAFVAAGRRVGWIPLGPVDATTQDAMAEKTGVVCIALPDDPRGYAGRLYDSLHRLEQAGVAAIVAQTPPDRPEWAAVRDRLLRAAAE
jgi:L-threonylcarbamoyladenylate synthase